MSKTKVMSATEFREEGYLQELNRCFLHPLGLALATTIDHEAGTEVFGPVYDCRSDPEGIIFDDEVVGSEEFQEKHGKVLGEIVRCSERRAEALGFTVQATR